MRLADKVVVVTGAASGIGAASAQRFSKEGARVVLADILEDEAHAKAEIINARGGTAVAIKCDVRQADDVHRAVKTAVDRWGRLDVMFNNAGVNVHGLVGDMSEEAFFECIDLNLASVYRGCHFAAPIMERQHGGSIINTSSIQAVRGFWTFPAYAAAKAGILGLTRQIAVDYGKAGVRVNAILPGAINTPMSQAELLHMGKNALETNDRVPLLSRWGTPEEVASTALFLASDDSSYITGQSILVDGGFSIAGTRPGEADVSG